MTVRIRNNSGRRELRAQLQATHKVLVIDENDSVRRAKLGSRRSRRAGTVIFDSKGNRSEGPRRIGKLFRPVYGHAILVSPSHKQVIAAMKSADRHAKLRYNTSF